MKTKLKLLTLGAIALACLAFPLLLTPGCAALQKVDWPQLVSCGSDAGADLVDDATQILYSEGINKHTIGDKAKDAFTDLARQHGPKVVACVVQQLINKWTGAGAAAEPRRAAATDRATDFLRLVGTEVKVEGSGGEH